MQELEKILEEIDAIKTGFDTECSSECDLFDWSCGACVGECDEYIKERAKDIVRKHLSRENDPGIARCSRDTEGAEPEINLPKEEFDILRFDDSVTFRCGNEYISLYMGEDEAVREYKHMNDGWIPVEERLPINHEGAVEVTVRAGYRTVGYYDEYREEWWTLDEDSILDVVAWKEPSEPYHPERSEENEQSYKGFSQQYS